MPTIIVPTISPPVPIEDLRLFNDVEGAERGPQSIRRANRSRLEVVGHRPPAISATAAVSVKPVSHIIDLDQCASALSARKLI